MNDRKDVALAEPSPTFAGRGCRPTRAFTLPEILIVIAIAGMAALLISHTFSTLIQVHVAQKSRQERLHRLAAVLDDVAVDLRKARAITSSEQDRLSIWLDDADQDGIPSHAEMVSYERSSDGDAGWCRRQGEGESPLEAVTTMEFGCDLPPPATRHVIIRAYSESARDSLSLGTSVAIRARMLP